MITFDDGQGTVEGNERFAGGMKTLAAAIRKQIGCKPEDGDPDLNAGRKMAEMMGGNILTHEPVAPIAKNEEEQGSREILGGGDAGCVYVLVYKAPKGHPKSPRFFAIKRLSRSAVVWT